MRQYLVLVTAIISLVGYMFYIRGMFRGTVKPNRVSLFMWALAAFIATAAAVSDGVTWAVVPVFMAGFPPFITLICSFIAKDGYWKMGLFDYLCGLLSLLALGLWAITKNPDIAIIFAILSDGLATIPTLLKTWRHPNTEIAFPYYAGLLGAGAAFIAITTWTFSSYAFPAYLVAYNGSILLGIYFGGREVGQRSSS